ncbi:hypothetical protein CVT25_003492 [Psilocybe cyanescens]|uniref:Uncharacterized protein n=1 Tax=Psilocybe cyanescens TaxID=93625 RepID=A0A409WMA0_PSICY|nr:hypothetical protein CVT25_003492 [Psilocybe cyanescens]
MPVEQPRSMMLRASVLAHKPCAAADDLQYLIYATLGQLGPDQPELTVAPECESSMEELSVQQYPGHLHREFSNMDPKFEKADKGRPTCCALKSAKEDKVLHFWAITA